MKTIQRFSEKIMRTPQKQTDAEIIKQLLAEGARRDASEMRLRKILFWVIFLVLDAIILFGVYILSWSFKNAVWEIMIDCGISAILFTGLRAALGPDKDNSTLDFLTSILKWTMLWSK